MLSDVERIVLDTIERRAAQRAQAESEALAHADDHESVPQDDKRRRRVQRRRRRPRLGRPGRRVA